MNTLYILNSPKNLSSCLDHITKDDGLLLIEDAVIVACDAINVENQNLMVLEEDLSARGITNSHSQWRNINFENFVKQTLSYQKSLSWL